VKITGIKTFCLRYDMPYALTHARGEYSTREALLVKLLTDDPAIFGWGESAMWAAPRGDRGGDRARSTPHCRPDPRRPNTSGRRSSRRPITTAAEESSSRRSQASISRSGTSSANARACPSGGSSAASAGR
jgi:hypothetical protein